MKGKWIPVALIIFGMLLGGVIVWSAVQMTVTIHTVCTIKTVGVGVYWDSGCTNRCATIDWGSLYPASNKSVTVYIRNEGNVNSTLSITTASWSPSGANNTITFSNNYDGRVLQPNGVVQVLFTLSISPSITGINQFSFDIVVTISG